MEGPSSAEGAVLVKHRFETCKDWQYKWKFLNNGRESNNRVGVAWNRLCDGCGDWEQRKFGIVVCPG